MSYLRQVQREWLASSPGVFGHFAGLIAVFIGEFSRCITRTVFGGASPSDGHVIATLSLFVLLQPRLHIFLSYQATYLLNFVLWPIATDSMVN